MLFLNILIFFNESNFMLKNYMTIIMGKNKHQISTNLFLTFQTYSSMADFLKYINELSEFYWTNLFQRVCNLNLSKKSLLHNKINIFNPKVIIFFPMFIS